jgi:hypothetical protein
MYGQLIISMFVCLDSSTSRGKRVRLATYPCRNREECDEKLVEFAEANSMLWSSMKAHISAKWIVCDHVF